MMIFVREATISRSKHFIATVTNDSATRFSSDMIKLIVVTDEFVKHGEGISSSYCGGYGHEMADLDICLVSCYKIVII